MSLKAFARCSVVRSNDGLGTAAAVLGAFDTRLVAGCGMEVLPVELTSGDEVGEMREARNDIFPRNPSTLGC